MPTMRRGSLRLTAIASAVLGMTAGSVLAQDVSALLHVRGLDAGARSLITDARAASPTVAGLMAKLDESDVIVLVSVTFMRDGVPADTRFVTATTRVRILSLRIDLLAAPWDKVEYLGHELQHALEVAQARDVHSDDGLRTLMTRIGRRRDSARQYETDGAIATAHRVRQEVGLTGTK